MEHAAEAEMTERCWKTRDVAEFLQASESWVRHAAAEGRLPCTKIGGLLRFDPAEIRALVESARSEPARVLPPGA
jgi:excisionase family DNA binding protein